MAVVSRLKLVLNYRGFARLHIAPEQIDGKRADGMLLSSDFDLEPKSMI